MEQKKKRGRPPKVPKTPLFKPLELLASQTNETPARGLQYGYKILQEILNIPKSRLFLEKPDENLFGLHDYYEIIKQPMWLSEVSRKFDNKEYTELKEVITDFRLMLENCYSFWGAKHKFSKHAFRIEKILEKHLKELPGNLKIICNVLIDNSNNDNSNESESALLDAYQSKILQNLGKKVKDENQEITNMDELFKWESEVLMSRQTKKHINSIVELADIGFYLKLTHQVLCVKPATQYEIERMLLIPKESSTLATLMTAFLCPTAMRGSLYLKPLMTYEVWTAILCRKLDSWCNAYLKFQNKIQVFLKYGIEPFFWDVIGPKNPLLNVEFHTLPLIKKAWILKTLCTTIFHSNKKIEEYFNSIDDTKLRGNVLYEDNKFIYINEFSPEIRVYRIIKHDGEYDDTMKEVIPSYFNSASITSEDDSGVVNSTSSFSNCKKNKVSLVASDREALVMLKSTFNRKRKSLLAVEKLLAKEQNKRQSIKGLMSMHAQWMKFNARSPNVVEISRNHWINKVTPSSLAFNTDGEGDSTKNGSGLIICGKRSLKKKFSFKEVHSSSSNEEKLSEESTSDWEDGNIRRSKRIRRSKISFPRQWERRYEGEIYETHSRPYASESKSYNYTTSKVYTPEFPNPKDYVTFMQHQQQKIISICNRKKYGVTIRKTLMNPSKRSIVAAAVENANKQTDGKKELESNKVLTISMGESQSPNPITPLASTLNDTEKMYSISSNIFNKAISVQSSNRSLLSNLTNISAIPKASNFSSILPEMPTNKVDHLSTPSTEKVLESFLSQWVAEKSPLPNQHPAFPATSTPIVERDAAATHFTII